MWKCLVKIPGNSAILENDNAWENDSALRVTRPGTKLMVLPTVQLIFYGFLLCLLHLNSCAPFPKLGGWGVTPTRKSFRFVSFRFVLLSSVCVRAVWLPSAIQTEIRGRTFSLSSFALPSFPFSLVWVMSEVYEVDKVYKVCKVVLPTAAPKPPMQLQLALSVLSDVFVLHENEWHLILPIRCPIFNRFADTASCTHTQIWLQPRSCRYRKRRSVVQKPALVGVFGLSPIAMNRLATMVLGLEDCQLSRFCWKFVSNSGWLLLIVRTVDDCRVSVDVV